MKTLFFDSHNRLRSGYLLLISLIIPFASTFAASIPAYIIMLLTPDFPPVTVVGNGVVTVVYSMAAVVFSLLFSKKAFQFAFKNQEFSDLDCYSLNRKTFYRILIGMGIGIACFTVTVLPLYLTGQYRLEPAKIQIIPLILNLMFFTSAGVLEEVSSRGLMQHALLRFGRWPALLIISIVFGLMHLSNPNITVNSVIGLILIGFFMGISMYATNSINIAIGIHITWNWIQGPFLGIPVSGIDFGANVFQTTILGSDPLITGGAFGAEASIYCIITLLILSFLMFLYGKKKKYL